MKIFGTDVPSMYSWTIFLISALVVLESYLYHQVPLNLLVSVIVSSVLDLLIKKFYLKRNLSFPYSAIISGLIIGSVAPIDSPIFLGIVASLIAILSKFFIRIKNSHIFNPATLGLLISLILFSQGDQWWAANGFNTMGYIIPFAFILIISNYKANKIVNSVSYLITSFLIGIILSILNHFQITTFIFITSILQLNFFYAFIMVSEPKTSPFRRKEQIFFGGGVAILTYLFSLTGFSFSLLASLLIANLAYAIWKFLPKKNK